MTGVDARIAALGDDLYHDPILSADGSVSCASCHGLAAGGDDDRPVSVGIRRQEGPINAPTVFNSAHNFVQFWDGRAASLEEQAAGPVENPLEMGAKWADVVARVGADERYRVRFDELFGGDVSVVTITKAIADFERTLTTPNSRFDKYLKGDMSALTDEEKRGAVLFAESGCMSCHTGSYFGGESYQKLAESYFAARGASITDADFGRFNVTGKDEDKHLFKVPMLRNVAVTAPYFHDGAAADLRTAVVGMGEHQLGLDLAADEVDAIVAFLKTLTGEYKGVPLDQMQGR